MTQADGKLDLVVFILNGQKVFKSQTKKTLNLQWNEHSDTIVRGSYIYHNFVPYLPVVCLFFPRG